MTDRGYITLHREHFPAYCQARQIRPEDRGVFEHLILEADWRDGIVRNFTLTTCSREIGFGTRSGRRTLESRIRRLCDLGVITYTSAAGRLPGAVSVVDFTLLTTRSSADLAARSRAPSRALPRDMRAAKREVSARHARAQTAKHPLSPGDSQTEEVNLGLRKNLASERGGSSTPKDWADADLETLLAPLLELCRRTSKPGITHRAGALATLAGYSRAQIAHAVSVFMPELRNARADRFEKPVGVFLAKARAGAVEYFTTGDVVAPPAPPARLAATAQRPTDGEHRVAQLKASFASAGGGR